MASSVLEATKQMCATCFSVVENTFDAAKPILHLNDHAGISCPLFVTWNKRKHERSQEWHLRGCIGTFSPLALSDGLVSYARTSAFRDHRFQPIDHTELEHLQCSVSLLTNFEKANHFLDWEVGKHGIWIEFTAEDGRRRTATYLPEVMPEQGWSKMEAIDSLLRKGQFRGRITDAVRDSIILTRYQSSKATITYDEYVKLGGQAL